MIKPDYISLRNTQIETISWVTIPWRIIGETTITCISLSRSSGIKEHGRKLLNWLYYLIDREKNFIDSRIYSIEKINKEFHSDLISKILIKIFVGRNGNENHGGC